MSEHDHGQSPNQHKRGGRRKFFGGLALGGLLGTLAASSVGLWAHEQGPEGGWHGRGWCKGGTRTGSLTPEERAARADQMTERMLDRLNATPEQKSRIKAIVQDALKDLGPVRDEHLKNREAFVAALKQPTVDRAALKQIRTAEMQLADSASDRLLNAIADAADALTPEQRTKLAELADRFRR